MMTSRLIPTALGLCLCVMTAGTGAGTENPALPRDPRPTAGNPVETDILPGPIPGTSLIKAYLPSDYVCFFLATQAGSWDITAEAHPKDSFATKLWDNSKK